MKEGIYNRRIYNRRLEAFKKAKAEWQAKQAALPDDHPHKGAVDDKVLRTGYQLAWAEKDPSKQQALREWLEEAPCLPH